MGSGALLGIAAEQIPDLPAVLTEQLSQAQQVIGVDTQPAGGRFARGYLVNAAYIVKGWEERSPGGLEFVGGGLLPPQLHQVGVQVAGRRVQQALTGLFCYGGGEAGWLQLCQQAGGQGGVEQLFRQVQGQEEAVAGAPLSTAVQQGIPVDLILIALQGGQQVVQVAQLQAEVVVVEVQDQVQQQVFGAEHMRLSAGQVGGLGALPQGLQVDGVLAVGCDQVPVQLDDAGACLDEGG